MNLDINLCVGGNTDFDEKRAHWWNVWRKKHDLSKRNLCYLAFIAGWNAGVIFNKKSPNQALQLSGGSSPKAGQVKPKASTK